MTFSDFLEKYALLISALIAAIILVLIIIFLVLPKLNPKVADEVEAEEESHEIIKALGGIENISDMSSQGSRVTLTLKDKTMVDEVALKKHGVSRTIVMEEKIILLVSETIATNLNKLR